MGGKQDARAFWQACSAKSFRLPPASLLTRGLEKRGDVDADRLHIDGAQNQIFLGTAFEFDFDAQTIGKSIGEAFHSCE